MLPRNLFSESSVDEHTRFTQTQSKHRAARLVKGRRGRKGQQPVARQLRKVHAGLASGAVAFSFQAEPNSTTTLCNLANSLAIIDDLRGFKVSFGLQSSML